MQLEEMVQRAIIHRDTVKVAVGARVMFAARKLLGAQGITGMAQIKNYARELSRTLRKDPAQWHPTQVAKVEQAGEALGRRPTLPVSSGRSLEELPRTLPTDVADRYWEIQRLNKDTLNGLMSSNHAHEFPRRDLLQSVMTALKPKTWKERFRGVHPYELSNRLAPLMEKAVLGPNWQGRRGGLTNEIADKAIQFVSAKNRPAARAKGIVREILSQKAQFARKRLEETWADLFKSTDSGQDAAKTLQGLAETVSGGIHTRPNRMLKQIREQVQQKVPAAITTIDSQLDNPAVHQAQLLTRMRQAVIRDRLQQRLSHAAGGNADALATSGRHSDAMRQAKLPTADASLSSPEVPVSQAYAGFQPSTTWLPRRSVATPSPTDFLPTKDPVWYTAYPEIAAGYAKRPQDYLESIPTQVLRQTGPSSPRFHPHVAKDTRATTLAQLDGIKQTAGSSDWGSRPHYEGVFTDPGLTHHTQRALYKRLPSGSGFQQVKQPFTPQRPIT